MYKSQQFSHIIQETSTTIRVKEITVHVEWFSPIIMEAILTISANSAIYTA